MGKIYGLLVTVGLVLGFTESAMAYVFRVNADGAPDYWIESTIASGSSVSKGDRVTVKAKENEILRFVSWSDGKTNPERNITITGDIDIKAKYASDGVVCGWDFYKAGNENRKADIGGTNNSILYLYNGNEKSKWLDKSAEKGGYEGDACAIIWQNLGECYYQAEVSTTGLGNVKVYSRMSYNYNAYKKQKLEYSTDGAVWKSGSEIELGAEKEWILNIAELPQDAWNANKLYLRWIADKTSQIAGAEGNDGTSIKDIYITGTPTSSTSSSLKLVGTIPSNNGIGERTGSIVLEFDGNIRLKEGYTATFNNIVFTGYTVGKYAIFPYKGVRSDVCKFVLSAGVIESIDGSQTYREDIVIDYTSESNDPVVKRLFDYVVGVDGDWKGAYEALNSHNSDRYYVFFPNGEYDLGSTTGDSNQMTKINNSNVSLIGQSTEGVILYNKPTNEGISITATIDITKKDNIYMQDLTIQNRGDYFNATQGGAGRFVCLRDQGNKNAYRGVRLLSYQDTYYSPSGARMSYWEKSEIHGVVDFICGGGDVYFYDCLIYCEDRNGDVITAPNGTTEWGYVFESCTIDGAPSTNNTYRLGRSWNGKASAVYLNTTMKVLPNAEGWGEPMNTVPTKFAEFNSRNIYGGEVDLSQRKRYYSCSKDNSTAYLNPVLSAEEAAKYTIENVLSGWNPREMTEQVEKRTLTNDGLTLVWNDTDKAMCYVVFENGKYLDMTVDNEYTPKSPNLQSKYTVRAANMYGGLSEESDAVNLSEKAQSDDIIYYDNGTISSRAGTDKNNLWTAASSSLDGVKLSITGRDDKDLLYGNDITYEGAKYKSFKTSNGAQNTLTLPEGTVLKRIKFIGYTNAEDGESVLSEINGEAYNYTFDNNTSVEGYAQNPTVIDYVPKESVCGELTFTFGNKQACLIIDIETEIGECDKSGIEKVDSEERKEKVVYDALGRRVYDVRRGAVYIVK